MKETVLVVDDDLVVLPLLAKMVESCGLKVLKTDSPLEALEIIQSQPIQVLVTDLRMDNLDGVTLFREAKTSIPMLRGICCSAYLDYDSMTSVIEAGFDDCMLKPINKMRLCAAVIESLGIRQRWQNRLAELRGIMGNA